MDLSNATNENKTTKMFVDVHQIPKSFLKFILLSFQHVFAMFGANILVPLVINSNFGQEIIPIQIAFLGSGLGTIIYLLCTSFKVPIYLGSSFAFMTTIGTFYANSGYSTYLSLLLIGVIYVVIATMIKLTHSNHVIKRILPPVVIGIAIMLIGLGAIYNGAINDFGIGIFGDSTQSQSFETAWLYIGIATFTFIAIVLFMLFFKNFLKVIPILMGLLIGTLFALIIWAILFNTNKELALKIFDPNGNAFALLHPEQWKWFPDVSHLWSNDKIQASLTKNFDINPLLGLLPLSLITIAEHIGDHINIGNLTNRDYIQDQPGIHRTLLGDGLATIVSVAFGGVPNTSYGENTSVISISRVASVWVIFAASIIAIFTSFIAPISALIQAIPKPVLGGIEIVLFSMIAVNGLRILIQNKVDMFNLKNIIIISAVLLFGIAGIAGKGLTFYEAGDFNITISGTGFGVIIGMILNLVLPDEKENIENYIYSIDFVPNDIFKIVKNKFKKTKAKDTK